MFTLVDVRNEFDRLDKQFGIDTTGIDIVISTRGIVRRAAVVYEKRVPVLVRISSYMFEENEDVFFNTVRHEYAHILTGLRYPREDHGHDGVWKEACVEVGCRPNRISAHTDVSKKHTRERAKYIVCCPKCGIEWERYRLSKMITSIRDQANHGYRCSKCNGKVQLKK